MAELRGVLTTEAITARLGVTLLSEHEITDETTLSGRLSHFRLFARLLDAMKAGDAFYVGYANGDFFLVRKLRSDEQRRYFGADEQTEFVVQSIDHQDGLATGRHLHLDADGKVLREIIKPDYAKTYDPRRRSWYRRAQDSADIVRIDPYIFASTGTAGITLAKQGAEGEAVVGVDSSIESLWIAAAKLKPTPSANVVIFDDKGLVIAADDLSFVKERASAGEAVGITLSDLPSPAVRAVARSADVAATMQRFTIDGDVYFGWKLPATSFRGPPLFVMVTIPEDELMADAYRGLRQMLLLSGVILVIALTLTLLASYTISRALAKLTAAADRFRRFDFDTPLSNRSAITEVRRLTDGFIALRDTLQRYRHLLSSIAREKDLTTLQPTILAELSAVLEARDAILYVVPEQVDGLVAAAFKAGDRIELLEIEQEDPDPLPSLVAESLHTGDRLATSGQIAASETQLPGLARIGAPDSGFENALCYPLRNRKDEVNGAILFLDCADASDGARALVGALTGAASLALESRQLIASEKALFTAFIPLIAGAIDAKSPYTGGHCERVPELTKMLAKAATDADDGPFRDFALSEDEWEAVHVAAWLHDCGKITSPEYVVDKATKLETIYDRIHEVRMRFEVLKRDAEIQALNAVLAGEGLDSARAQRDAEWQRLDDDFAFVAKCNEGGEFLGELELARLQSISERTWTRTLDDRLGISDDERARKAAVGGSTLPVEEPLLADRPDHIIERPARDVLGSDNPWGFRLKQPKHLYNRGERYNLSVSRGTLSEEERYKINEHIVQTIIMLSALPYPRHLRQVPELAGGHHEKMDGTGYPRCLTGLEMSPVARMMAIADIFEALTAADRPYKRGKPLSVSLKIMRNMADEGHIDPALFNLFLTSGVFRQYAERFVDPAQIDEVSIDGFQVIPAT